MPADVGDHLGAVGRVGRFGRAGSAIGDELSCMRFELVEDLLANDREATRGQGVRSPNSAAEVGSRSGLQVAGIRHAPGVDFE